MARIYENAPLKKRHTFGVDAVARRLIEFRSIDDLRQLHAAGELIGAIAIGGGSNMLFTQKTVEPTLIHCGMKEVTVGPKDPDGKVSVRAEAGAVLDEVVAMSVERGLWGLENLSLIPGETGGAAVQTVGAYGTEAADTISRVEAFDMSTGEIRTFSPGELEYGYRHSVFKQPDTAGRYIVTAVTFTLCANGEPSTSYTALKRELEAMRGTPTPADVRRAVIAMRQAKLPDPAVTGSAGSFFKNPVTDATTARNIAATEGIDMADAPFHTLPDGNVKLSAAWLIDRAGGKNLACGGASVWPRQPLVIINTRGTATGADITGLEQLIIRAVRDRFGITLTPEVMHI